MSKSFSSRAPRSARPFVMRSNPQAAGGSGRRVLVVGKFGPAPCGDCGGFQTVKVRAGRVLVAVDCRSCTPPAVALAG